MNEGEAASSEIEELHRAIARFLQQPRPVDDRQDDCEDDCEGHWVPEDDYRDSLQLLGAAWDGVMSLNGDGRLRFCYGNHDRPLLVDEDCLQEMGSRIGEARALASIGAWSASCDLIDQLMITTDDRQLSSLWQMVHTWPVSIDPDLVAVHQRLYMSLNLLRQHPLSRFSRQAILA